jgi:hypothetical protein
MSWRLNAGNETEVMDARGRNVARAHCGGSYGVKVEEAEAHARLIAAAPDLLAALEDGLQWMQYGGEIDGIFFDEASLVESFREVIAKAKGEA